MMDQAAPVRAAHTADARVWLWFGTWPMEVVLTRPYRCECADTARWVDDGCIGTVATETRFQGVAYARRWTVTRSRPRGPVRWGRAPSMGHVWDRWTLWHLDTLQFIPGKAEPLRDLGHAIARHPSHGDPCAGRTVESGSGSVEDAISHFREAVRQQCAREVARVKLRAFTGARWDDSPDEPVIDLTATGPRVIEYRLGDPAGPKQRFDEHPALRVEVLPGAPWQWVARVGEVADVADDGTERVIVRFADSDRETFNVADLARARPGQRDPGGLCENGHARAVCGLLCKCYREAP